MQRQQPSANKQPEDDQRDGEQVNHGTFPFIPKKKRLMKPVRAHQALHWPGQGACWRYDRAGVLPLYGRAGGGSGGLQSDP